MMSRNNIIGIIVFLLCVIVLGGCKKQGASEPIEHNIEDRFIYFTALNGDNVINIEMTKGKSEIMVAMDFGELSLTLASEDGEVILDTDATYSSEYTVSIPRTGTYVLTLKGTGASGSVNY